MSQLVTRVSVGITAGNAVSSVFYLGNRVPKILEMSAVWTAACISFAGSVDNVNWYFICDTAGTLVTCLASEGYRINLPYAHLTNHLSMCICSGTRDTPVLQIADRILYVELWE